MLGERNTSEELLKAFHDDAKWWKLTILYIENELEFISRLLSSRIYKENTPNLFEHLEKFKHAMGTKKRETENLKKELFEYESTLRGILECQDVSCDTYYLENHKALKERFKEFTIGFNDYKTKLHNYLGAILLTT